jgi:hypothetical protein
MITLELGLEMEHAALRFWTALAEGDLDRLRRARMGTTAGTTSATTAE